ncbi:MAG: ubiquinone/menaquinone biosynthesis methyltransferase [Acidobacteriia bacterium]|jgi:demethylmenaquinone methyltransferase/2-methoxy-6-polyprenyl-1,4-benzoquinol methylase|nr:ubiquinone/menaquinone biosynthesis methyltransferase [Terriglobia bacterium]
MPSRTPSPLPAGSRPAGAQDESDAARRVREMFARIAPRYDLLNHLLSLGLDVVWRRRAALRFRHLLARPGVRVLDVCCGTGDLAVALARRALRERQRLHVTELVPTLVCADFAHPMLVRAREKVGTAFRPHSASGGSLVFCFLEADALALPFPEDSFDLVTAAFGFRNLANYFRGAQEIARVLRPGGELGILEFAEPAGWGAPLCRFYVRRLLPGIGAAVSGDRGAYSYLPASVAAFPTPEAVTQLLAESGFADVQVERWTAGLVAFYTARKADRAGG